MSDSNRPVRRRRIAGEGAPGAPAQKAVAQRAAAKKTVAKVNRPPVKKTAPVARATPAPKVSKASNQRAPGSRPSRRDLLWLVPGTAITAAVLVLGALWVVSPPGSSDRGADLDTSRRQASSAAASAAETIFSFRFDQLDQHLTASKALMTSAFGKEFDTIAPALTELAPQRNIVVQAVSRESAALPCGDECSSTKADVLVFVDQARLVGDSTQPTVFANRIKVSMVKDDDGWLVSNIRAL